ncbi:LysR family transcriptional regulator [Achromobacter xylosoxidans]
MRNLNLDQIQTLIAIADLGTFAAASQALHLAPPTISLHIKELEARMQVPLVLRSRHGRTDGGGPGAGRGRTQAAGRQR